VIPDDMKLKCSTCGQEIDSLLSHICAPAEPLAELDALRQRVAELEATAQALRTECVRFGNSLNWDNTPESWVLALQRMKQVLDNDPCDNGAGATLRLSLPIRGSTK
jgi:hypothetical protein